MEDTRKFPGSVYNLHVLAWSLQAGVKRRAVEPSQRGAGWLWGPDCSSEGYLWFYHSNLTGARACLFFLTPWLQAVLMQSATTSPTKQTEGMRKGCQTSLAHRDSVAQPCW